MSDPHISPIVPTSQQAVKAIQQEVASENAMQVESDDSLDQYCEPATFNPMAQAQRFRNLKEIHTKQPQAPTESDETESVEPVIVDVEVIEEVSERFHKNNFELNAKTLRILRSQVNKATTSDEILKVVEEVYAEAVLADEALDFLLETSDAQLQMATQEAKEKLNKDRGKEIKAGRNMGAQAREFSQQGLGTPTSLRELYRDITLNPRDPLKLFDELTERFRYPKLKSAITFMLHALGSDMKSKGPSIQRGELKRLIDETRSMQAILGVFRFFQSRMKMIQREFSSYELVMPAKLDFELLSRLFAKILAERFMSPDKIIQSAKLLGIGEELAAQIIIYSQMRDALKQIAPRYFRDPRHREELLKTFMDTIDKLEDMLEEEENEENEK